MDRREFIKASIAAAAGIGRPVVIFRVMTQKQVLNFAIKQHPELKQLIAAPLKKFVNTSLYRELLEYLRKGTMAEFLESVGFRPATKVRKVFGVQSKWALLVGRAAQCH